MRLLLLLLICVPALIHGRSTLACNPFQEPKVEQDIFQAARSGNTERIKTLLAAGIDVNSRTAYGATPLFYACDRGNLELVELLLEKGADPNVSDTFYKATPITWAAQNGHNDIVVKLLTNGGTGGDALLTAAFESENVEFAKLLLNAKVVSEQTLFKAKSIAEKKQSKELSALLEGMDIPEPGVTYKPTTKELATLAGQYKTEAVTATVKVDGANLTVNFGEGNDSRLEPVALNKFSVGTGTLVFTVVDGESTAVTMDFGAGKTVLKREVAAKADPKAEMPKEPESNKLTKPKFAPSSSASLAADRLVSSNNWPSFRGNGARGVAEGQNPPTEWNVADKKNLLWKTPVAGLGLSCPVIWDDHIYITTAISPDAGELKIGLYGSVASVEDDSVYEFQVICVNKKDGSVVWKKTAKKSKPAVKRHAKSSHANPTVAANENCIVAFFGSEGLYCYSHDGQLKWNVDFGVLDSGWFYDPGYQWGFGSSPIIYDNMVIVQCDIQNGSFVAALDIKSGKELWRIARDEIPSWSSPTVHKFGDTEMLLTHGTRAARGYDVRSGQLLWQLPEHSEIVVPTPFVAHDLIYIASGYRPIQPIYAIKPSSRGDLTLPHDTSTSENIAWSLKRGGPYMPSPIVYGDYLYCCSNSGILTCYHASTGDQVYKKRLKSEGGTMSFVASPLAGDGRLYMTAEDGRCYIVKAGPEFKQIADNDVGEHILATPAVSDGVMYFRTQNSLIAVGNPSDSTTK